MATDMVGNEQAPVNAAIHLAYYHHAYAYHPYSVADWITHMVVSAVVHSLIYGLVFKLMQGMTLSEAVVLVEVGLLEVYFWELRRDRRS